MSLYISTYEMNQFKNCVKTNDWLFLEENEQVKLSQLSASQLSIYPPLSPKDLQANLPRMFSF